MKDKLLSLILLVDPDHKHRIAEYVKEAVSHLPQDCEQYQVIVVQDGGSPATDFTQGLHDEQGIRYICLAQQSGSAKAVSAGFEAAIGDLCLSIVTAKDPMELIPKFFERCESEGGLVVGQRLNPEREGKWLFKIGRRFFHFIAYGLLGSKFPKHTTFMACFDRNALNTINQAGDRERYFRALTSHVGIPVSTILYDLQHPQLRSLAESINISLDILFMNSVKPLRMATYFSLSLMGLCIVYLFSMIFETFAQSREHALSAFFIPAIAAGFFFILAILTEYVQRLLLEVRDRPTYTVAQDWSTSARVHGIDRPNITAVPTADRKTFGSR
jgi:hypothetical protein